MFVNLGGVFLIVYSLQKSEQGIFAGTWLALDPTCFVSSLFGAG
jgi:hypothetical protein